MASQDLSLPYILLGAEAKAIFRCLHWTIQNQPSLLDWSSTDCPGCTFSDACFSVNRESSQAVNLLVIIIISFALILWLYFAQWVYITPVTNVLEVLSLCNLCLTSIVILFELSRNRGSPVAIYISSGIAFALFTVICILHAFKQDHLRKAVTVLIHKAQRKFQNNKPTQIINDYDAEPKLNVPEDEITHTVVELSELLLQAKNTSRSS